MQQEEKLESQSSSEEAGEKTSRQKGNEMAEKFEQSGLGNLEKEENLQQTLALLFSKNSSVEVHVQL